VGVPADTALSWLGSDRISSRCVDVEIRKVRVRRQRGVQALDLRMMMLVVMELHRLGVDGRF